MKLVSAATRIAGSISELVRIAGQVRLDSGDGFEISFETSGELEHQLSRSGNPWIVAMLPYALPKGERIVCDRPVDPQLLENLRGDWPRSGASGTRSFLLRKSSPRSAASGLP